MPGFPPPIQIIRQRVKAKQARDHAAKATGSYPTIPDPSNALHRVLKHKGASVNKAGIVDVLGMQKYLRGKGYNISADGKLGPVTKAALADFLNPKGKIGDALSQALAGTHITGHRNVAAFNAKFGNAPVKAFRPRGQLLDKHGNDPTPKSARGPVGGGGGGGGRVNLNPLAQIAAGIGAAIPDSMATSASDQGFDPQIHDLGIQLARAPRDTAQALHDISSWYGQVLSSEHTAGTRDHAMNAAAQGSAKDAAAAIVASLGGSANQGAGLVGAAGENVAGTLAAEGNAQDQYNNDLAPLLKLAQAGALTSQRAKGVASTQDLRNQIADLVGQRGQARLGALMQSRQYNNTLGQQNFQDQLALENAQLAAQMTGAKVASLISSAAKGPKLPKIDVNKAMNDAVGLLGLKSTTLPQGFHIPNLAHAISSALLAQGVPRGSASYHQLGNQIISSFLGANGSPIQPQMGWFT